MKSYGFGDGMNKEATKTTTINPHLTEDSYSVKKANEDMRQPFVQERTICHIRNFFPNGTLTECLSAQSTSRLR
eukprot:779592-Amphidinium_carterae.1